MVKQKGPTLSYLLQLWPVHSDDKQIWRASLQNARSGEQYGRHSSHHKEVWVFVRGIAIVAARAGLHCHLAMTS